MKIGLSLLLVVNLLFSQNSVYMHISSTVDIHLIITDPAGRRCGYDPRGAIINKGVKYREIPGAEYSTESVGDSPDTTVHAEKGDVQHVFEYIENIPQIDGTYFIKAIGTMTEEPFRLFVDAHAMDGSTARAFRAELIGVCSKDSVVEYRFTYHGALDSEIQLEKLVKFSTLRQDLSASYKLKLLGAEKVFKEINKNLDKVEKELSKKDSAEAREKLQEWWKEIEEVRKEMIKEGEKDKDEKKEKFIREDAYKILKEDTQILLAKLPQKRK